MKDFGLFCLVVVALAVIILINGFTFSVLWEWVVVEIFKVQSITIMQGAGVSLLLTYVKRKQSLKKRDEEISFKSILNSVANSVAYSGFMLLLCWILTLLY